MVSINGNELLINVVKFDKPKMLTGLDQKVRGRMSPLMLEAHGQQDRRRIITTEAEASHVSLFSQWIDLSHFSLLRQMESHGLFGQCSLSESRTFLPVAQRLLWNSDASEFLGASHR
ncbi:hypothetical protein NXC24_PA00164 (plasmid) [Rhizobium sp. NXC24]|nr:hypothetical protein NXC24_PA00164 [Rhizobium sp. NXC24]